MKIDIFLLQICQCAVFQIKILMLIITFKAFTDNQISCICVKQVSMWATYYNIAGNNFNLLVLLLFVERIGCFLISNFIAKYIISPTRKGRKITEGITLIIRESVAILFIIEKIQIQNILIIIKRALKPLLYMP